MGPKRQNIGRSTRQAKRMRMRSKGSAASRGQENCGEEAGGDGDGISENQSIAAEAVRETVEVAVPVRLRSPTLVRERAEKYYHDNFIANEFGHACNVCDRLWFMKDLRRVSEGMVDMLAIEFPNENVRDFMVCTNCYRVCRSNKIPPLSKSNGYAYPPKPANLPKLDPLTERLVSPRIPYMQIRRLRSWGMYGILGQIINVPVNVDTMVGCLPRALTDDHAFNVNLKKNIIHKSSYLSGSVKKRDVRAWLEYLIEQPLYKHYGITVDWTVFNESVVDTDGAAEEAIEELNVETASGAEMFAARQQTMLWNEDYCLDIAPGQNRIPESLLFDQYAEELSFPAIYYGHGRNIKNGGGKWATPYSMCTSEIRRRDRRGVTPQHILYMAMKILRFRVRDGIQNMFRCLRGTERITKDMILDRDYVRGLVDTNMAFFKSIPNSVQYWHSRKKDVFAMLRQLGRPSAFLTLSANEIRWPNLLRILHRISDEFKSLGPTLEESEIFEKLDGYKRAHLVAEDPVTCAIYFNKLVRVIMAMLTTKKSYNPFGKHRVVDYFTRIEWQNRGSPHAHILMWLEMDPRETVSENMTGTVQLCTDLLSVDKNDLVSPEMIKNQTHAHTFTCTKRGEKRCRFNIPYWPMDKTIILLPMSKDESRRKALSRRANDARDRLETKTYDSIEDFLTDIGCDRDAYLDLIRSSLSRPTIIFKRDMTQIFINTFNPWIASVLNSNTDLQIILDAYSCAAYVVDYVSKSERGMGNLHRALINIHEENPHFDKAQLISTHGVRLLNNVEMSAQEAAWVLLKQAMSWSSRITVTIPTMHLHERYRARKRTSVLDAENLPGDSTDIWTKSLVEKYEERPGDLEQETLAQFTAWWAPKRSNEQASEENHDLNEDSDDDHNDTPAREYRKRKLSRIIRYRHYDKTDLLNHKREMVMLHWPFRNELVDVIDRNKFVEIYDTNEQLILERRKEFEADVNIEDEIARIEAICVMTERIDEVEPQTEDNPYAGSEPLTGSDMLEGMTTSISAVRRRSNVLTKEAYCAMMRMTNPDQREMVLEVIHRHHLLNRDPIQVFLTGAAGCGKTFLLKVLMETYNRYTQQHDAVHNAYIASATTGKAAVALHGVTMHSAFRLTRSRQTHQLSADILQTYRMRLQNVKCVIIDEISMCGSSDFATVNARLQAMTGVFETNFGGLDLIISGDLKQLPPVRATPVYSTAQQVIGGAVLWQSLDYYPLRKIMRQTDERFSRLLTKIGGGRPLTAEETALLQDRFRTRAWCEKNIPATVMRLFYSNIDVQTHNTAVLPTTESSEHAIALDKYTGYRSEAERRTAIRKVHQKLTRDTGGLPYSITLTKNFPYMVTVNVDVQDGLVNGEIGRLKFVELYPSRDGDTEKKRIWLEFATDSVGRSCRIKYGPHVRSKPGVLSERWVPIELRSANITIKLKDNAVNCQRIQFPLVPAGALTIHKSQGGTFDQIVYSYDQTHPQQLVYVALSRVTSIDGLYLTNATDDLMFYHCAGSDAPTVREVRNEYRRLEEHRLSTITSTMKHFLDVPKSQKALIILNVNVQSLHAHSQDIATDELLTAADVLVLTETWVTSADHQVPINGYELLTQMPCGKTGGVALYRRITEQTTLTINPVHQIPPPPPTEDINHHSDVLITEVIHNEINIRFTLVAIYVHQQTSYQDLVNMLEAKLVNYVSHADTDKTDESLVLLGDFNITNENRTKLENYLESRYRLTLDTDITEPTTLGKTCIDLTCDDEPKAERL